MYVACPEQEYSQSYTVFRCEWGLPSKRNYWRRDVCWYMLGLRFLNWVSESVVPKKPEYANESTCSYITKCYFIIYFFRHFMLFCIIIMQLGTYKQLTSNWVLRRALKTLPNLLCFPSQDYSDGGHSPLLVPMRTSTIIIIVDVYEYVHRTPAK